MCGQIKGATREINYLFTSKYVPIQKHYIQCTYNQGCKMMWYTHVNTSCTIDVTMGTCEEENITYDDGEIFMKDLCTTCQCNNGTINCTVETCPDCEQGTQPFNVSHQCCPECRPGKN